MIVNNEKQFNLSMGDVQEYDQPTERDLVDLEFATIIYDYRLHPDAVKRIELLFDKLMTLGRVESEGDAE